MKIYLQFCLVLTALVMSPPAQALSDIDPATTLCRRTDGVRFKAKPIEFSEAAARGAPQYLISSSDGSLKPVQAVRVESGKGQVAFRTSDGKEVLNLSNPSLKCGVVYE